MSKANTQKSIEKYIFTFASYTYIASGRRYDLTFFTATILEWKHLLANDLFKHIIMDSLRFTVKENRAYLNAFVIMDNHLHLLWQIIHPHDREKVQQSFMKFTAQRSLRSLGITTLNCFNNSM